MKLRGVGMVLAALSSATVLWAGAADGAVAKSCNSHAANIKIISARGMTCKAARQDMNRSLSVCCPARFRSAGGFSCTVSTTFVSRCVRGSRSYRFTGVE